METENLSTRKEEYARLVSILPFSVGLVQIIDNVGSSVQLQIATLTGFSALRSEATSAIFNR